jgi:hypothetical protein
VIRHLLRLRELLVQIIEEYWARILSTVLFGLATLQLTGQVISGRGESGAAR